MSSTIDATKLLRPGLLDGVNVLVATATPGAAGAAGGDRGALAAAVVSACADLGACVSPWSPGDEVAPDVDQLVVDAAAAFAQAERGLEAQDARAALSACLDGAWEATRTIAGAAFIDAGRAGRVVYLAPATPPPGAPGSTHADAARAGLENLARTLSIEWARYGVTLVTIAPGQRTTAAEVAAATAFLGSPAGAYFSGCLFDLRGPGGAT